MNNTADYALLVRLCDEAGIPRTILCKRILHISAVTHRNWVLGGAPTDKKPVVAELSRTIQAALDKGLLPKSKDELLWLGIQKATETLND